MSRHKSKVDPTPIGDTNGRVEKIVKLPSGNLLCLDHTTDPPSYFIAGGVVNYYISDEQAVAAAQDANHKLQMTRECEDMVLRLNK